MNKIPDGALLQKSKNNVSYVYFPSYYYDKDAKTHNKEKQKRLYIGKVVGGEFVPNKKYLTNPELSRKDVGSLVSAPADLSKIQTRSLGATSLLNSLANKVGLTQDLTSVYGEDMARQMLSLAMFMTIDCKIQPFPRRIPKFPCITRTSPPKWHHSTGLLAQLKEKHS